MRNNKGITLVILSITMIIIFFLSGVCLTIILGDNGILAKIKRNNEQNEKTSIIEQIEDRIEHKKSENKVGIRESEFIKILKEYGTLSGEKDILNQTLTTTDEKIVIKVSDIYDGKFISETAKMVLNYGSKTIKVGENVKISATLDNIIGMVTWSVDNTSTISLSNISGNDVNVIGKSVGTVTLTATCKEYTAICEITVVE